MKTLEEANEEHFQLFDNEVCAELRMRQNFDALDIASTCLRHYAYITREIRRTLADRFQPNELLAIFAALWGSMSSQEVSGDILIWSVEEADQYEHIGSRFEVNIPTVIAKLTSLNQIESLVLFDAFLIFQEADNIQPQEVFRI